MTTTTNIATKWYPTDNTSGIDFQKTQTISVTTAPEYPGLQANLGDLAVGNNESLWLFVMASTPVSTNNLVAIDCNFSAYNLTASLAASLKYNVGIAQFSNASVANSGDYFWALLRAGGGATVNTVASITGTAVAASGVYLYASSQQAGAVISTLTATSTTTIAGATNALLKNIYINSTVTGTTTTLDAVSLYNIAASI
jgi:hypothetical protein